MWGRILRRHPDGIILIQQLSCDQLEPWVFAVYRDEILPSFIGIEIFLGVR